ncbi:NUDIX hydrolase [Brevibacillus laterosporus]|uniref:NUDIX hydrolase n=1 Tax=Brevibacillus laterosporus TaxID=1465 RepID=UPI003D20FA85
MAKDTLLYKNKWLSVYERELDNGIKWVYGRHGWCNGAGVAILPFKKVLVNPGWNHSELRYLGRIELCPAHSEVPDLSAVAGGMDKDGETPIQVAVRELHEETGYKASEDDMIYLGTCRPSKGTDTTMYLYAVDVTNAEEGEPVGDGSMIETMASTKWIERVEALYSKDPLLVTMVSRLEIKF